MLFRSVLSRAALATIALVLASVEAPVSSAADAPQRAAEELRLVVVVHPTRSDALDREALAQIYLRRRRLWDDGSAIAPLNLPSGDALRESFSQRVLHLSPARLADYWNREYFGGVLPPATLASTAAVLRYVAADRNAIGYLRVSEVDEQVRVDRKSTRLNSSHRL